MTSPDNNDKKKAALGFLWFAIIAFALMLAVWLVLFILAAMNPVEQVPLKPSRADTPAALVRHAA